jgi:hypothetical protein
MAEHKEHELLFHRLKEQMESELEGEQLSASGRKIQAAVAANHLNLANPLRRRPFKGSRCDGCTFIVSVTPSRGAYTSQSRYFASLEPWSVDE